MCRHRSSNACSSSAVSSVAQRDEVGPAHGDVVLARLVGQREVRVVGERRVARHPEVVLHPALGGQPVVVPAHRVEELPAPHPPVAGDGVGLHVAEDRSHVERARHGRWGGVDGEDLGAAGTVLEAVRARLLPGSGPPVLEAFEGRLVGDVGRTGPGGRHDRVTVPGVLRLHDTATGTVRPLELRSAGEVSMYVCGPTVYDLPHIGHGRANLTFDILRRYLSFTGLRVHHVANVTDVDDNIIKRASALGRTEPDVAAEFEARWWESMDALGDLRPQEIPHATEYIDRTDCARGPADGPGDGVRDARRRLPGGVQGRRIRPPGRSSRWSRCRPGRGSRPTRTSAHRSTSPSGRRRRTANPAGTRRGGGAGPGGTPSAWSCRSTCWARDSTSTAAART